MEKFVSLRLEKIKKLFGRRGKFTSSLKRKI
jgi:hypothetical protein